VEGYETISKLLHKRETFKTADNLPGSGRLRKFTPRPDRATLRETSKSIKEPKELHLRLFRPQLAC